MIDGLTVINLKKGSTVLPHGGEVFSLCTCQRTIIIGLGLTPIKYIDHTQNLSKIYQGKDGYQFLLETILGLQSEVLAEYEVVNQFKDAYQNYNLSSDKNTHIISILEKLFKDQKRVRTDHLMEVGQLSYAGIARKLIHGNINTKNILVLGSGKLAVDTINLLKKKYNITISARNSEKVEALKAEHNLEVIPWLAIDQYAKFSCIVNTIGADQVLLDETFFTHWHSHNFLTPTKLFIDLGSPSVLKTSLNKKDGVLRLEDIFEESLKLGKEKMEKVENAKMAIVQLSQERHQSFTMSFPFGWEELQFA